MLAAVPIVVVSFGFDQPDNANRVAYHGPGLRLALADVSADTLRRLMVELLVSEEATSRVKEMGHLFEQAEIQQPAVKFILADLKRAAASA